jgi:transposase
MPLLCGLNRKAMANNLLPMIQIRLIVQLLQKGFAYRRIGREINVSRNTVKGYIKCLLSSGQSLDALQAMDDASLSALVYTDSKQKQSDPRHEDFLQRLSYFKEELKRTGVTKLLLWQEYKNQYSTGYGYSQFCLLLFQMGQVQNATMRFTHRPGEVMMVDFAGDLLQYVDRESGAIFDCPVFVAVLPYSGYSFAIALGDAKQPNVIKALNECLNYFTGVPQCLKCDNMKQAVSKSCRYEPVFTHTLQHWALHNNITLMATRPAKPKDKASVENEVKLTYQRIYAPLRDRIFFSLNELNAAIKEQLIEHHHLPFQKKTYSRQELFTREEQPLLQPLPENVYTILHTAEVKVQKTYHVTVGGHSYSVPFSYIGKKVSVVYDTDTVEIYFQHKRIALHRRSNERGGTTTQEEHMPENHLHQREKEKKNSEYYHAEAEKIGPHCVLYMEGILNSRRFPEQIYRSCEGLLRLSKAYTAQRLEAACKRALKGHSFSSNTVKAILGKNLDKLEGIEAPSCFTMPGHDNLRGPEAYS